MSIPNLRPPLMPTSREDGIASSLQELDLLSLDQVKHLIVKINEWAEGSLGQNNVGLLYQGVEQNLAELQRENLGFESIRMALGDFDSDEGAQSELMGFLVRAQNQIDQEKSSSSSSNRPQQIRSAISKAMQDLLGELAKKLEQLMSGSSIIGSSSSVSGEPQFSPKNPENGNAPGRSFHPLLQFVVPSYPESSQGLRSLKENPLRDFKKLRFGLCGINLGDFDEKYLKWFEALNRGISPASGKDYLANLERYKARLGILEAEEGFSPKNTKHLTKIEEAVVGILSELSKENPDLNSLQCSIQIIQEHAYELIIDPEKEVRAWIGSYFRIYMENQLEFRAELKKIAEEETLSEPILDAMRQGNIGEVREKLLREYPNKKEIIFRLAEAAKQLLGKAIEQAIKEIRDYQNRPEVKICYESFLACPHLLIKYEMLTQGKYASLEDIPREFFLSGKIDYPSYIPRLSALIVACQNLKQRNFNKKEFENYLQSQKIYRHFQEVIVPLAYFLEVVDTLLLWPKVYEPSEGEWEFLKTSIMFLMSIANKNIPGNIRVSYEYLSISEDKIKSEDALLRKKDVPLKRKREACRYLYHRLIPWKALRTIGSLTHGSGGVSAQELIAKDQLLRTAIAPFVQDLLQVKEAIVSLINFELSEFDSEPSIIRLQTFPSTYVHINLLGNFEESRVHLRKCLCTLQYWNNLSLRADDFSNPKIQYAILRTIQLQGEITKNIREMGILGKDPVWKLFEEIRDLLSHSERTQTERRLDQLLKPENRFVFESIPDDFRNIREFLQIRNRLLNACETWEERLTYLDAGKKQETYLELPGLERLFVFLTNKISEDRQVELLNYLLLDEAKKCRTQISTIVQEFMNLKFDSATYQNLVKLLPLTTTQKKEVENGIKLFIKPKAAENDARDAKPSMLKVSISIVNSLLENKRGNYPKDELEKFKKMLEKCQDSIGSDQFTEQVTETRKYFESLEKMGKSSLPREKLDVIRENLTHVIENVEEYTKRKTERLFSILSEIHIYSDDLSVKEKGAQLIRDMQLSKVSPNKLEIDLDELGIKGEAKKIWEESNCSCLSKQKTESANEGDRNETQIQRLIEKIENRLKRLDQLMIYQSARSIMKDPLLLLACQYLISDFRSAASNLELRLESLKYILSPWNREFIQDIQRTLRFFTEQGNGILHAHDISEPGTVTAEGIKFFTQQNVGSLIYNFNTGEKRDVLIESLFSKLHKLKKLF